MRQIGARGQVKWSEAYVAWPQRVSVSSFSSSAEREKWNFLFFPYCDPLSFALFISPAINILLDELKTK